MHRAMASVKYQPGSHINRIPRSGSLPRVHTLPLIVPGLTEVTEGPI